MEPGKRYFFKTVTHHYLGELVSFTPTHAVLKNASEVYETGALADFYGKGLPKYSERVPDGWHVPLMGTCWVEWSHPLPKKAVGDDR